MDARFRLIYGDITEQPVDAIVNAANRALMGGGGVDGAIHRVAGPGLLVECKSIAPCEPGEAKITSGYRLPAKYVLHTVGPFWRGGTANEAAVLANCYRNCFIITARHRIRSIAFPSIGTGAYRFPVDQAARIALAEIAAFLDNCDNDLFEKVAVVCFDSYTHQIYQDALTEMT